MAQLDNTNTNVFRAVLRDQQQNQKGLGGAVRPKEGLEAEFEAALRSGRFDQPSWRASDVDMSIDENAAIPSASMPYADIIGPSRQQKFLKALKIGITVVGAIGSVLTVP